MSNEWIFWDENNQADYVEPKVVKEWINKSEIQKELGFHEAGHLIIERLIIKVNIPGSNFSEHNFMYINSDLKKGAVNGFLQNVNWKGSLWTDQNYNLFKESIINNKRATIATLFSLIAGYTTYKKFIDDSEYFIGLPSNDNNKVEYFKIDTVKHGTHRSKIDKTHWGVSDFAKIKERLGFLGITDTRILNELYQSLHEKNLQIMSMGAVENSIRFIKNRLIEKDSEKIEGRSLKKYISFVDQLMINIDITKLVDGFETELNSCLINNN